MELFQTLRAYRKQKHNVVISTEHFTSKFPDGAKSGKLFKRIFKNIFLYQEKGYVTHTKQSINSKGPKNMESRGTLLNGAKRDAENRRRLIMNGASGLHADESFKFGFNVKIVVNYRHYFQWLPSYYFQKKLMDQRSKNQHTLIEYIEEAIESLGSEYLFDSGNTKNTTWLQTIPPGLNKVHGTLWSYMKWTSSPSLQNRVDIFDLHQQRIIMNDTEALQEEELPKPDLFQSFACQALPDATETCSQVRKANETLIVRARAEGGAGSSLETGKLSDTQLYQLKFAALGREENFTTTFEVDPDQSIFQYRRFQNKVEKLIRANFYDWAEERRASASVDDHRQLCLSEESTLALKSISWNMLRHLEALVTMRDKNIRESGSEELDKLFKAPKIHQPKYPLLLSPQKYAQQPNTNEKDEEWWAHIKRNHDRLFERIVESNAYCELDLDRLLADQNFVRQVFFRLDDVYGRKNSAEYLKFF